jgi:hypothetical protein
MGFEQLKGRAVLTPIDIKMLQRVLEATLPAGASAKEREAHAATLVTLFKSGITREENLVSTFTGSPTS